MSRCWQKKLIRSLIIKPSLWKIQVLNRLFDFFSNLHLSSFWNKLFWPKRTFIWIESKTRFRIFFSKIIFTLFDGSSKVWKINPKHEQNRKSELTILQIRKIAKNNICKKNCKNIYLTIFSSKFEATEYLLDLWEESFFLKFIDPSRFVSRIIINLFSLVFV